MNKETIKKLTIIKLVQKSGNELSYKNNQGSFLSILTFHDAVELFLKMMPNTIPFTSTDYDISPMPENGIKPLTEHYKRSNENF